MDRAASNITQDVDSSGRTRLSLKGRVTVVDAARLHQVALDVSVLEEDVIVCCADAEYLDAAAVQVILALGRDLTGRGRRCDVIGVAGQLAALFRVAGLG